MSERTAELERNTKETQSKARINLDGTGQTKVKTPIGLLDHMLDLFAFHGFFDLELKVAGDTNVDYHHTCEDIGVVLGKVFKKALGENLKGIKRYGVGFAPMESTLCRSVVDICGRPHYKFQVGTPGAPTPEIKDQDNFSMKYLEHMVEAFAKSLGATIHVTIESPDEDLHTTIETVFKSLGQAMDQATKVDPRRKNSVPSTKGVID